MMGHREVLIGGGEYDVVTGWRKVLVCAKRPGWCRYYKRKISRRARKIAKLEVQKEARMT